MMNAAYRKDNGYYRESNEIRFNTYVELKSKIESIREKLRIRNSAEKTALLSLAVASPVVSFILGILLNM